MHKITLIHTELAQSPHWLTALAQHGGGGLANARRSMGSIKDG